jgi:hypothetical protein
MISAESKISNKLAERSIVNRKVTASGEVKTASFQVGIHSSAIKIEDV